MSKCLLLLTIKIVQKMHTFGKISYYFSELGSLQYLNSIQEFLEKNFSTHYPLITRKYNKYPNLIYNVNILI